MDQILFFVPSFPFLFFPCGDFDEERERGKTSSCHLRRSSSSSPCRLQSSGFPLSRSSFFVIKTHWLIKVEIWGWLLMGLFVY
ncbi:unnamed protein product [Cuscuta campestris]|uniref:Uncharacterized protein n=1 Tax=Cuscuta campestris TaxID=132261 RepID=A0A484N8X6_9ASTE|nr:unnamed protein product [Cuscuta campestris]